MTVNSTTASAPTPKKKTSPWVFVGIGCLGVILLLVITGVLIFALVFSVTSAPVKVVNAQLDAIRAGDFQKAYTYCSEEFKRATSFENFKFFVQQQPSLSNNQRVKISSREIKNDICTLKGTLVSKNGGVTPVKYRLVKEEKRWRILSVRIFFGE